MAMVLGNQKEMNSLTPEMMKENLLISYTPNCFPKELSTWTCYWCKMLNYKINVKDYFNDPVTDTFGYIGETEKESKKKNFFFFLTS